MRSARGSRLGSRVQAGQGRRRRPAGHRSGGHPRRGHRVPHRRWRSLPCVSRPSACRGDGHPGSGGRSTIAVRRAMDEADEAVPVVVSGSFHLLAAVHGASVPDQHVPLGPFRRPPHPNGGPMPRSGARILVAERRRRSSASWPRSSGPPTPAGGRSGTSPTRPLAGWIRGSRCTRPRPWGCRWPGSGSRDQPIATARAGAARPTSGRRHGAVASHVDGVSTCRPGRPHPGAHRRRRHLPVQPDRADGRARGGGPVRSATTWRSASAGRTTPTSTSVGSPWPAPARSCSSSAAATRCCSAP